MASRQKNYTGPQKLLGFKPGARVEDALIDAEGMFAFDSSIKSVGIDIGAATNPLVFDMDRDASQLVLAFEPVFAEQLGKDMERVAEEVAARGGCETRWESFCINQRLVVIPSAVSSEIGHAEFHVGGNPYCSSLSGAPGKIDPTLEQHPDPQVREVFKGCQGSLNEAKPMTVPTITLASILRRIPKDVRVKYLKIDAQGHDFKILLSGAEEMKRLEYVRFEMQVDPPEGRKMVADIPSYAEVVAKMKEWGFVSEEPACDFDGNSSPFSKAIQEKECVFCRELPCKENGVQPFGEDPYTRNPKM